MVPANTTTSRGPGPDTSRVSTLELFFDLVFVFTVTQVTQVIDHQPDPAGVAQGVLILVVLFWMYGGFAWLTNAIGTDGTPQRLIVLAGMAALFVCSQAVPQAFGDDGIVIGVGFLVLTLLHLAGFLWLGGPAGSPVLTAIRADQHRRRAADPGRRLGRPACGTGCCGGRPHCCSRPPTFGRHITGCRCGPRTSPSGTV